MNLGMLGAAASGLATGIGQGADLAARRLQIQRAQQADAEHQAQMNAQRAGLEAYRRTMMDVYGHAVPAQRPPMPGQASVPMIQPNAALGPVAPPMGGAQPMGGLSPYQPGGAPPLPPYRPLQRGGQVEPQANAQFELSQKPTKPQLDMQVIMKNAPTDRDAFDFYMNKMSPYLSSQDKAALEQSKLELQFERAHNQLLESEQRIANATTPAERKAALEANLAIKKQLVGIARENADTRREAVSKSGAKASEKKQIYDSAKAEEMQLIGELRDIVTTHPEVVGLSGGVTRIGEAVGGALGTTQSTVANDFQRKVRMLQNVIKKIDAYGPEGRVLKGELADRDVLVKGLGSFTSAPAVLSGLDDLEKFAKMGERPAASGAAGTPAPAARSTQLTADDQQAIAWARSNPNDPRSKQILSMHGM